MFFNKNLKMEYSLLQKFIDACRKIELDPNYQPSITDKQFFALIRDENHCRHSPRKDATAIQKLDKVPLSPCGDYLGVFYQIKIATKRPIDDTEYPYWVIDNSAVIFVNKTGAISLHDLTDVMKKVYLATS